MSAVPCFKFRQDSHLRRFSRRSFRRSISLFREGKLLSTMALKLAGLREVGPSELIAADGESSDGVLSTVGEDKTCRGDDTSWTITVATSRILPSFLINRRYFYVGRNFPTSGSSYATYNIRKRSVHSGTPSRFTSHRSDTALFQPEPGPDSCLGHSSS